MLHKTMCKILPSKSDIRLLRSTIAKSKREPYNILFNVGLHQVLNGIWKADVFVDDWPNPAAAAIASRWPNQNIRHDVIFYHEDEDKLLSMMTTAKIIPKHKKIYFPWVPVSIQASLEDIVSRNQGTLAPVGTAFAAITPRQIQNIEKSLPDGYTIRSLNQDLDTEIVFKYYDPGLGSTNNNYDTLYYNIATCPSSAVCNSDNEPVSWAMVQYNGLAGAGFTLPKYRRTNMYQLVVSDLERRSHEHGIVSVGMVGAENKAKLGFVTKNGGILYDEHLFGAFFVQPSNHHTSSSKI